MDRLIAEEPLRPWAKLVGVAIVVLLPVLKDLVDGNALPAGGMVVVERVFLAEPKNGLRIKGERIRLEAINGGDVGPIGSLIRRRRRGWASDRARWTPVVAGFGGAVGAGIGRQT